MADPVHVLGARDHAHAAADFAEAANACHLAGDYENAALARTQAQTHALAAIALAMTGDGVTVFSWPQGIID